LSRKIRSDIELKVTQNWLKGMTRAENALDCGISTGAVSNIVNGWLDSMSSYDREAVIEFVVHLRKQKISLVECALGYRIHNIIDALGISEDEKNWKFSSKTPMIFVHG